MKEMTEKAEMAEEAEEAKTLEEMTNKEAEEFDNFITEQEKEISKKMYAYNITLDIVRNCVKTKVLFYLSKKEVQTISKKLTSVPENIFFKNKFENVFMNENSKKFIELLESQNADDFEIAETDSKRELVCSEYINRSGGFFNHIEINLLSDGHVRQNTCRQQNGVAKISIDDDCLILERSYFLKRSTHFQNFCYQCEYQSVCAEAYFEQRKKGHACCTGVFDLRTKKEVKTFCNFLYNETIQNFIKDLTD